MVSKSCDSLYSRYRDWQYQMFTYYKHLNLGGNKKQPLHLIKDICVLPYEVDTDSIVMHHVERQLTPVLHTILDADHFMKGYMKIVMSVDIDVDRSLPYTFPCVLLPVIVPSCLKLNIKFVEAVELFTKENQTKTFAFCGIYYIRSGSQTGANRREVGSRVVYMQFSTLPFIASPSSLYFFILFTILEQLRDPSVNQYPSSLIQPICSKILIRPK